MPFVAALRSPSRKLALAFPIRQSVAASTKNFLVGVVVAPHSLLGLSPRNARCGIHQKFPCRSCGGAALAARLVASQRSLRHPPKISLSEIFGGGARNRTGVLKKSDKSRYMFSLSINLNPALSDKQDRSGSSLLVVVPVSKAKLPEPAYCPHFFAP